MQQEDGCGRIWAPVSSQCFTGESKAAPASAIHARSSPQSRCNQLSVGSPAYAIILASQQSRKGQPARTINVTTSSERKPGRGMLIAAILIACVVGVLGGAIGGAAGAMWVINTVGSPKVSPKAKNAVVEYDAMPREGARPVDVAGLTRSGTPLHPCLIDFLREQEAVIGDAEWTRVRLHPYFKDDDDIVNQLAFSRGAIGITRGNDIYINVPYAPDAIDQLNENLLF